MPNHHVSYYNHDRVVAALTARPRTERELAAHLHITTATARLAIRRLRQTGKSYIAAWRRQGLCGPAAAVYALGNKPDAPKPKPKTTSQKSAAWRARGNDSHRSRAIQRELAKINKRSTLAGMLGL